MIINMDVPLDRLTVAIEKAPPHWRPILTAVRDHGCAYMIVPQGGHRFMAPEGLPLIAVIGDDLFSAHGPDGFHGASMKRLVRRCSAAVIVSSEATVRSYAAGATNAVLLRQDVLIVETRPEQEIPWIKFVRKHRPDIAMLVSTIPGGNA